MGYEVTYFYYPKSSEGYNMQEKMVFTRTIGKMEEVPLEELAQSMMRQMARRDILIVDAEIHEYTKKRITFREVEGGIVIKNKKFSLDSLGSLTAQEQPVAANLPPPMPQSVPQSVTQSDDVQEDLVIIRYEVYDPDPEFDGMMRSKGFNLRAGSKYAIVEEISKPMSVRMPTGEVVQSPFGGLLYRIIDGDGRRVVIPSTCMTPPLKTLSGDAPEAGMVDIRRGRAMSVPEPNMPDLNMLRRRSQ